MKTRFTKLSLLAPVLGLAVFAALPATSQAGDRHDRDDHRTYFRYDDRHDSHHHSQYDWQRRNSQSQCETSRFSQHRDVHQHRHYDSHRESSNPVARHLERRADIHRSLHRLIFGH